MATSVAAPAAPRGHQLSVLSFTVLVFLVMDNLLTALSILIDRGAVQSALHTVGTGSLSVLAVVLLFRRQLRWCAAVSLLVAFLALTTGPSSEEPWLIICAGVVVAAHQPRRQVLLVLGAQTAYSLAFGAVVAVRFSVSGGLWAGGALLAMSWVSVAGGMIARRFLAARDRRRQQVLALEQENLQIHRAERTRLTVELRTVIDGELGLLRRRLTAPPSPRDVTALLAGVQRDCRRVLVDVRILLGVLRETPTAPPQRPLPGRTLEFLGRPWVRLTATALLGAWLAAVLLHAGTPARISGLSHATAALALVALAAAIWRPIPAAVLAGALTLLPLFSREWSFWGVLPPSLLCLLGAVRFGARRAWLVLAGLAGYCVALALSLPHGQLGALAGLAYASLIAISIGLFAAGVRASSAQALLRMADLREEQQVIRSRERDALARELHDVVGHQLSLATMLVMASEGSTDPVELDRTLDKVRQCIDAADAELSILLDAMRSEQSDPLAPLVTPATSARALSDTLREHGFHPSVEVSPDSDRLSATTLRTLARIMQEATTNIIRYAPRGSSCEVRLSLTASEVRLRVTNPMGAPSSRVALSSGFGLRGIRERVELMEGTFRAGRQDGDWVLEACLPTAEADSTRLVAAASPDDGSTGVRLGLRQPDPAMGRRRPAGVSTMPDA